MGYYDDKYKYYNLLGELCIDLSWNYPMLVELVQANRDMLEKANLTEAQREVIYKEFAAELERIKEKDGN